MSIEECYSQLHGSYAEVKKRLMVDRLVEKFMLKFPDDPSMQQLDDAIASGSNGEAFRAVHTLKGVAANLAFTELWQAASDLTEQMRGKDCPADPLLYDNVRVAYDNTVAAIRAYDSDN